MTTDDVLISGHAVLADWLMLFAFIFFVAAGLLAAVKRPDPTNGALVPVGLALTALALLVL